MRILLLGLLGSAALIAGCGRPIARDASGKPVFDDTKFRHLANTPYFCFSLVDDRGDQTSRCAVIKEWCAAELDSSKAERATILSGCREVESVSCLVGYRAGAGRSSAESLCMETPANCEAMSAHIVEAQGDNNVSICKTLDRGFQPRR
jgi:hypothetical protein